MKVKKEYLILLFIIAALSVYLALRNKNQTHFELPHPAQADSQKINRIVITKGDRTIELDKKDDQWSIAPKGYAADNIKVRNMVKAAVDLTPTDLISESGNYDRYDLTKDKKINVRAFADKQVVRNFDIGREAPTYQHTFALLENDPKVYQVRGRLDDTFNQTIDQLRDRTVVSFDKDDISTLTIEKGTQSLALKLAQAPVQSQAPAAADADKKSEASQQKSTPAKSAPQWQDPQGKAVDQAVVNGLLGDFSKFSCARFMADNAAEALKNATWKLTFKGAKGAHTFSVYQPEKEADTELPALSSQSPYAFLIGKSKAENIEKKLDKLLNPAPKSEEGTKAKAQADQKAQK
jgi:hypothetical protein